jgi:peptide/nickel transport system permease protein
MTMRWRVFFGDPLAVAGLVVLVLLGTAALFAPWLTPYSPAETRPLEMLQAPSPAHPLGTDDLGRDALSRLLHAGRASLTLAIGVAAVAVGIGALLGGIAGYLGGGVDSAVSALVDTMLSIPALALAMVASAFLELTTLRLVLILGLVSWPTVSRLVRGQVLSLKERDFVEAARATGAGHGRLLFRHLLPNAVTPVIIAGTLLVAYAVLIESALSFLGFGLPPPTATWGGMLNDAQLYYLEAPWLAVFPGLAITLAVAAINFVGDGLREAASGRTGEA